MIEKRSTDRTRIVSSLIRISHGELSEYITEAMPIAIDDPNLFAHIISWNRLNGKIKDSKVVFPTIALRGAKEDELAENAIAHMVSLGPRELVRSYQFSKELSKSGSVIVHGHRRMLESALKEYLDVRENDKTWWDRAVISNRRAMTTLYAISHKKPSDRVQRILFEKNYPKGSIFDTVRNLKNMSPTDATAAIIKYKIPMQIIIGAVSSIKSEEILLALIENISGNELINSTNMLTKLGVMDRPILKSAFDAAIERAKKDTRVNVYKATTAAKIIKGKTADKLISVQREQETKLKGLEGNWLILGDRSGSMQQSIEISKKLASLLASQVKGNVYLIFFNTDPTFYDITNLKFDQIEKKVGSVSATGGTSIGCGLEYIKEKDIIINAIIIVSDGGDNTRPYFHDAYKLYCQKMAIEPTVYLFHVPGEQNALIPYCENENIQIESFEYGTDFDIYSLPNIINTLKSCRYSLLDEIMNTPLLTLEQVFNQNKKEEITCL